MSALPYTTYSRIDITCNAGAIATRCIVRVDTSTEPVDQVDNIIDGETSEPITYTDAAALLATFHAWVNSVGADIPTDWSKLELSCSNGKITATGIVRNGANYPQKIQAIRALTTTPITLANAQALLQAAHARVVAARGL